MHHHLFPFTLTDNQRQRFAQIRRLEQLGAMDPVEFEHFVGYLYEQQGFRVFLTGVTGDEGVDLLLTRGAETIVVQCKRYAGTVGQPVVRDLFGTMMHNQAQKAVLVTTGTLSRAAEEWAIGKPIELIDGHELMSWVRRLQKSDEPAVTLPRWVPIAAAAFLLLILCLVGFILLSTLRGDGDTTEEPVVAVPTDETPPATAITGGNAAATPTLAPTVTLAPPTATATLGPTPTPGPPTATPATLIDLDVPRPEFTPTLDGDLSEWAYVVPRITTAYITERLDSWDGSMDVEAIWQLGWDEQYFYAAVRIHDNLYVQADAAQFAYFGDSVELQFDTELDADYGAQVSPDDFQYIISAGNFGDLPSEAFRFQGDTTGNMNDAPGTQARVAAQRTDAGYNLEFVIPWSDMGVRPQTGLRLGVALSVNDNDTPGSRQQELMLSHISSRLWLDPSSWAVMVLN